MRLIKYCINFARGKIMQIIIIIIKLFWGSFSPFLSLCGGHLPRVWTESLCFTDQGVLNIQPFLFYYSLVWLKKIMFERSHIYGILCLKSIWLLEINKLAMKIGNVLKPLKHIWYSAFALASISLSNF